MTTTRGLSRRQFLFDFYYRMGWDRKFPMYLGSHCLTKQYPIQFVTINRTKMQIIINRGFSQRVFRNISKYSIERVHQALNKLYDSDGTWVHPHLWKSYQAIESGFGPPQSGSPASSSE